MGDPVFDAYYASGTQFLTPGEVRQQATVQNAGAALLDRIGKPTILIGHSQGGIVPWLIADARPNLTHAIIGIEPSGPPFKDVLFSTKPARPFGLTDAPLIYDPPIENPAIDFAKQTLLSTSPLATDCILQAEESPRQLANLKGIHVMLVTSPSSFHVQYDWCTVRYLQQAGVNASHLLLSEHGIQGNGHMMFLEKNSEDVAQLVMSKMQAFGSEKTRSWL